MNLYPYQQVGAKFLAERKYALLADEPGLGKTAQAIRGWCARGVDRVLVICPASARDNWAKEVRAWHEDEPSIEVIHKGARSDLKANVTITSYSLVDKVINAKRLLDGTSFGLLVVDESHFLKDTGAGRSKHVWGKIGVVRDCAAAWPMSGTPMPNNPSELWPMLYTLFPQTIHDSRKAPMSLSTFITRFCEVRHTGYGEQIVGGKNIPELRDRIRPIFLRRKKVDVLPELPPIVFDTYPISAEKARKALRQVEDTDEGRALAKALADGVDGLEKLAGHFATLRRLTGIAKAPAVAEMVKDEIEGGLRKVVVFAHHTAVLQALEAAFTGAGIKCVGIAGQTPAGKRQAMVDTFQTDPEYKVFLGQITAAGTAITLTAASDVVFAESSWVPADNSQAAMRCHRIGQTRGVLVRFATLAGSIDERVQRAVARKTATITELMG